jgi:RNA polymerase sigma-70 factor (ECF subfamily)
MRNSCEIPASKELAAIREGDHAAFIGVYHALHAKIFRFFLKRIPEHDTVKDLTQQCFVRLWQYRESLSVEHPLEKQIFIIARGLMINHIKKEVTQRKLKAIHVEMKEKELQEAAGHTQFEVTNEVNAAIETLPPVRKKIIILKAFHGCSNKEIASQLSISVKTVEDHVTKAFRHIRQTVVISH